MSPRNTSGTYNLPAGNPVTTLTTVSSTWANTTLGDLGGELTDSLSRSAKGPMLAPLRTVDGAAAAPAVAFSAEPASGFYRAGANDVRLALGGVDKVFWATTGVGIGAAPAATAVFSLSTANQPTVDFISTGGGAGNKEGRLTYDSGAAFGAPAWVFQNLSDVGAFVANGLIVFRSGLVALGSQATPLQPASLWTAITPNANWTAGNGLAYWKDAGGKIRLKGMVTFATGGVNPAFTLPAGFRPIALRRFPMVESITGTVAQAQIATNGDVTITAISGAGPANGNQYWLDTVSFLAEQ